LETSGHGRFPPLAPSTLRQKARKGYPAKPLFATGAMAASNATESGNDFANVFNTKPYSVFHTSHAPRTRIPQRDFFDIQEAAFDESAQIILNYLAGK
jgi:phage gpG-like protein